jgi:hypothetical protein
LEDQDHLTNKRYRGSINVTATISHRTKTRLHVGLNMFIAALLIDLEDDWKVIRATYVKLARRRLIGTALELASGRAHISRRSLVRRTESSAILSRFVGSGQRWGWETCRCIVGRRRYWQGTMSPISTTLLLHHAVARPMCVGGWAKRFQNARLWRIVVCLYMILQRDTRCIQY